jgi:hypothetical protein
LFLQSPGPRWALAATPTDLDGALEIALKCRRRRIDLGKRGDGRL